MHRKSHSRGWHTALVLALGLFVAGAVGAPTEAHAGPRDDMKSAYELAKTQFNELELDAAQATLEAAVARAQGAGMAADPGLAPLLVLRGGIIYSNTGDRSRTVAAFQEAVRADYNVALPIELRSDDLQQLLDEARAGVPAPGTGPIAHTTPAVAAGQDIVIDALSSVPVSEGVTMVIYWRKKGSDGEFESAYLETFGNLGSVTIPASAHGDAGIEYFFYVYNGNQQALANLGDKDKPLVLEMGAGGGGEGEGEGEGEGDGEEGGRKKKPSGPSSWPRVYINIGVGTGFGIARGVAEMTYQQFTPGTPGTYGLSEQACAIERWFAGNKPLASSPIEFSQDLIQITNPAVRPSGVTDDQLATAYNAQQCSRRHPVTTGFASAPFHLAPEVSFRVLDRDIGEQRSMAILLGVYSRLQVVTGSKVFTDDPNLSLDQSFTQQVLSGNPSGFQRKPPFTWAVGIKAKALIAKKGGKFQGMLGLFGGYGNARLRVNMGFSNDRNGNSVPDAVEAALSGPVDASGQVPVDQCTPVWPYNNGCSTDDLGNVERGLAASVQASNPSNENRIDTVRMGPGFAGVLFGFNYQLHKNFAVFGEVDVGGWFPDIGSLLIDVTAGPSITF
ncbi:hypothetical protein [Paraliomyxa miuraensis]|uniref:hypothetical protein n=1 Tax=Paraliomyxa miuraensis TaxID=376150 RepID=UPI00225B571D|nr:hypothetical protein [Paraliomyxa miuraensis]MCX4245397.1 hypothetical protein [Paraliomyxa miuraensis]